MEAWEPGEERTKGAPSLLGESEPKGLGSDRQVPSYSTWLNTLVNVTLLLAFTFFFKKDIQGCMSSM